MAVVVVTRYKEMLMDRVEINNLFDAMQQEKELRERAIFEAVYTNPEEANRRKLHFLHHVDECPPEVIGYCQALLAPKEEASAA